MNSSPRYSRCILRFVVFSSLLGVATLPAMPPRQHLLTGVVQSFDSPTQTLNLASVRPGLPSAVLIQPKRTRLREDGLPATLQQLTAAGPVRIYYRTELGRPVATEVSWRSATKKT